MSEGSDDQEALKAPRKRHPKRDVQCTNGYLFEAVGLCCFSTRFVNVNGIFGLVQDVHYINAGFNLYQKVLKASQPSVGDFHRDLTIGPNQPAQVRIQTYWQYIWYSIASKNDQSFDVLFEKSVKPHRFRG